ncbi:MAG: ABC transporter ATP-binding protein, partial [Chloroflexi bacterium]|nr:ABC transporter ATP-binding protein [Chloroflexota bacterium]
MKLQSTAGVLGRGFALVMSVDPLAGAAYLAIVVVVNVLPVLQVWLMKLLVDQLAAGLARAPDAATIATLGALYVLTLVVPAGLQPVHEVLASRLMDRSVAEVDRRLMRVGARLVDLVHLERPVFQDELRLLQEAAYRPPQLFWILQYVLGSLLPLVGLLLLLTQLHPLIPLVLILGTIPHLLAERRLSWLRYQAMARRSRAAREMDYCARLTADPAAAKEVRIFGLGDFFWRRFQERCVAALAEVSQLRLRALRTSTLFGGLHALALAVGFWYVAAQSGTGRLTLGDVALYLNAVVQVENRVMLLSFFFGMMHETVIHLRGLFHFLDRAAPAIALAPMGRGRPAPAALREGIEIRGVRFRYPGEVPSTPCPLPPLGG